MPRDAASSATRSFRRVSSHLSWPGSDVRACSVPRAGYARPLRCVQVLEGASNASPRSRCRAAVLALSALELSEQQLVCGAFERHRASAIGLPLLAVPSVTAASRSPLAVKHHAATAWTDRECPEPRSSSAATALLSAVDHRLRVIGARPRMATSASTASGMNPAVDTVGPPIGDRVDLVTQAVPMIGERLGIVAQRIPTNPSVAIGQSGRSRESTSSGALSRTTSVRACFGADRGRPRPTSARIQRITRRFSPPKLLSTVDGLARRRPRRRTCPTRVSGISVLNPATAIKSLSAPCSSQRRRTCNIAAYASLSCPRWANTKTLTRLAREQNRGIDVVIFEFQSPLQRLFVDATSTLQFPGVPAEPGLGSSALDRLSCLVSPTASPAVRNDR